MVFHVGGHKLRAAEVREILQKRTRWQWLSDKSIIMGVGSSSTCLNILVCTCRRSARLKCVVRTELLSFKQRSPICSGPFFGRSYKFRRAAGDQNQLPSTDRSVLYTTARELCVRCGWAREAICDLTRLSMLSSKAMKSIRYDKISQSFPVDADSATTLSRRIETLGPMISRDQPRRHWLSSI